MPSGQRKSILKTRKSPRKNVKFLPPAEVGKKKKGRESTLNQSDLDSILGSDKNDGKPSEAADFCPAEKDILVSEVLLNLDVLTANHGGARRQNPEKLAAWKKVVEAVNRSVKCSYLFSNLMSSVQF